MKFKKIRTKLLVFILPVIILAMAVLTIISTSSSKDTIETQIKEQMSAELSAEMNSIQEYLNIVSSTATTISKVVGTSYRHITLAEYEDMLEKIILENDIVLGSGLWFEPFVYDANEEYVGPYIYKDGDKVAVTYDYSNSTYDYFIQEYYTNAKSSSEAMITDPYYDETSQLIMASCSAPILDAANNFIGCVTVDIELSSIQNIVREIQVGKAGKGILLSNSGVYLGSDEEAKVETSALILEEENTSLVEAGNLILTTERGVTTYAERGSVYNLYYDTIPGVEWKLMIHMPQAELDEPVKNLTMILIGICIAAIILSVLAVVLQVNIISSSIKKVQIFAEYLAEGDFRVEPLNSKSSDELGRMSSSLNEMYHSNREVIQNIAEHAEQVNLSSNMLYESASELADQFSTIENYMSDVNEATMSASAAVEEVNASTEEVNASIVVLANETERSKEMSDEIRIRASKIGESSQNSYESAINLSEQYEVELKKSIRNAKVVENIGIMAEAIAGIADQINLLSLNASIEAARAGEHGKGFAVVATEIGHLANETTDVVTEIQSTITDVQKAFNHLTKGSKSLLEFVQETVTPDYNSFVDVAIQYGEDAKTIEENAMKISDMANNIRTIMNEVSEAIQNVAESSQTTADNSNKVLKSINEVSKVVEQVSNMSEKQEEVASDLNQVVSRFQLD